MKGTVLTVYIMLAFTITNAQEKNNTINNSAYAFSISEKDLLPESIAYDSESNSFLIGSTRKGKVVRIDESGKQIEFISPKQDGLLMVIGMKVDAVNRRLWVCSSGGENLIDYTFKDDIEGRPAGVFKFNLDTGKLIKKYVLNTKGEVHFFNDLVLDNNGNVYITHMFNKHSIYTIQKDKDKLEVFIEPDTLKYPNGITISDDNKFLFIAHSEGISRIEISTKNYISIKNPNNFNLAYRESIDGIYYYKNTLICVQPDIKTVQQLTLNSLLDTVNHSKLLEVNHPMMNNPTTGIIIDNVFYYVANAQFGSFDKNGNLFRLQKLYEPTILKTKLNE